MTKVFELFKRAVDHSPAIAKDRFNAAIIWAGEAHRRDHQSALDAYTKSLTLLGRRLILAPTIECQQNLLATVLKGLALDAAPFPSTEENSDLPLSYWIKGGLYYG